MASLSDQDRFFAGQIDASIPRHIVTEGSITRLLNGRFTEGAITNAVGFEEIYPELLATDTRPEASPVTYAEILARGDVQLVAPLENIAGNFLILVVSGTLFRLDLESHEIKNITPRDFVLPEKSSDYTLSYIDNDGGVSGSGGLLVIFNYPNKTIFVGVDSVRNAKESDYEVPPARMGVTAASRLFVIQGSNTMHASDPFGGSNPLAPLTFEESLANGASYYLQTFTIGQFLKANKVTAMCRIPRAAGVSDEFLARNLLVSTETFKYVVSPGTPRNEWDSTQFITEAGSLDGVAGPLACTNVGSTIFYISSTGRIKTLSQDVERDTSLAETYLDDALGQYLLPSEYSFYHRDWYRELDHSRSIVKFNRDRVYATVYPRSVPAVGRYGERFSSPSFSALAVGSIDPTTRLGPTAQIAWEGFYDWLQPIGMATIGKLLYIVSKDDYGRIRYYKEAPGTPDTHPTTIFTRGYLANAPGEKKSIASGMLYFRELAGPVEVSIYYLSDNKWVLGSHCTVDDRVHRFTFRDRTAQSSSASVPLRIEIDHKGKRFALESIHVNGEIHRISR